MGAVWLVHGRRSWAPVHGFSVRRIFDRYLKLLFTNAIKAENNEEHQKTKPLRKPSRLSQSSINIIQ